MSRVRSFNLESALIDVYRQVVNRPAVGLIFRWMSGKGQRATPISATFTPQIMTDIEAGWAQKWAQSPGVNLGPPPLTMIASEKTLSGLMIYRVECVSWM